jgi:hypothetical protein
MVLQQARSSSVVNQEPMASPKGGLVIVVPLHARAHRSIAVHPGALLPRINRWPRAVGIAYMLSITTVPVPRTWSSR